jgi:hypothetical protein
MTRHPALPCNSQPRLRRTSDRDRHCQSRTSSHAELRARKRRLRLGCGVAVSVTKRGMAANGRGPLMPPRCVLTRTRRRCEIIIVCRNCRDGRVGEQSTGLNLSKSSPLPGFESMTNTLLVDGSDMALTTHNDRTGCPLVPPAESIARGWRCQVGPRTRAIRGCIRVNRASVASAERCCSVASAVGLIAQVSEHSVVV